MAGEPWTEDHTTLALFLYFQLPFGKLHSGTLEIKELGDAIGRSHSSVAMKLSNFASLDPRITDTGRKGLTGASKLDRIVFDKFTRDWNGLIARAEMLWEAAVVKGNNQTLKEDRIEYEFKPFEGEAVVERIVEQRGGQGFFRKAVLANFEERCCITGIMDARLLNASHIVPWSVDAFNRHNPSNGFALSATFDRAFDRGLITIYAAGQVKISTQLLNHSDIRTRKYFERYDGETVRVASRFDPSPVFLAWHNTNRFIDAA